MKKAPILEKKELYYYHFGLKKIVDYQNKKTYPPYISGNISNELFGNCSGLSGDISSGLFGNCSGLFGKISGELFGNCSGLSGDISSGLSGNISSGLFGNISGIRGCVDNIVGNLNDCNITEKEREKGIDIKDLARFSKI